MKRSAMSRNTLASEPRPRSVPHSCASQAGSRQISGTQENNLILFDFHIGHQKVGSRFASEHLPNSPPSCSPLLEWAGIKTRRADVIEGGIRTNAAF
jgi:hypothetical protein